MRFLIILFFIVSCTTTPEYKVGKVLRTETRTFLTDSYDAIPDREPDLVSEHATLKDSPDITVTKWYRVNVASTKLLDFPSFKDGKIVGHLTQGDLVIGYEVEGKWVRVFDNSYAYLPHLQIIKKK